MNELKKELSRLSGIDFFNPKYRDVFKKYFADDKDNEEEKVNAMVDEPVVEDIKKAEDEREIDKIEEDKAETEEDKEEKAEEVKEESEEIGKEVDGVKEDKTDDELLNTKIELELVRAGIRDDKIEPAKRLLKYEVKDIKDLDKVKDILKEYPEWVKGYGNTPKAFGMPVAENGDGLTEEEKRLKQMGIDPRD